MQLNLDVQLTAYQIDCARVKKNKIVASILLAGISLFVFCLFSQIPIAWLCSFLYILASSAYLFSSGAFIDFEKASARDCQSLNRIAQDFPEVKEYVKKVNKMGRPFFKYETIGCEFIEEEAEDQAAIKSQKELYNIT